MTFAVICHGMPCIEIIIQLAAIVWTGHQETWIACLNAIDLKSLDTSLHHDRIFSASARVPPSLGCLHFNVRRHGGKVLHQHAVDEDVSAANTTEQDPVGAMVEEGDETPG